MTNKSPKRVYSGSRKIKITPDEIREINRLFDTGNSITTISKLTGRSVPVVERCIGVKP